MTNCTYKRHRTEPHEAEYGVFDVDDNLKGFVCQKALDEIQADVIGRVMKTRKVPDDGTQTR